MNLFNFYIPEWFFVALSLGLLVFILNRLFWKPVNKMLEERQDKITKSLKDAASIEVEKMEMEARRAEHEAEMGRYTGEQMKEARVRAGKEYDRIVAGAEEKAKAILSLARTQAERERESLMLTAKAELVAAALEAAGMLIGERMDDESNERFIETIMARKGAGV